MGSFMKGLWDFEDSGALAESVLLICILFDFTASIVLIYFTFVSLIVLMCPKFKLGSYEDIWELLLAGAAISFLWFGKNSIKNFLPKHLDSDASSGWLWVSFSISRLSYCF